MLCPFVVKVGSIVSSWEWILIDVCNPSSSYTGYGREILGEISNRLRKDLYEMLKVGLGKVQETSQLV